MNHLKRYTQYNESTDRGTLDNLIDEMITYFRKQFLKSNFSIRHKAITGLTSYTFSYKGEIYDIQYSNDNYSRLYKLNNEYIDRDLGRILVEILSKIFNNTNNFLRWIWKNIESDDAELQEDFSFVRNSLCERCDEFEIIKNGKIDLISLNQLYDFYNAPFDEEKIEIELSMRNFI